MRLEGARAELGEAIGAGDDGVAVGGRAGGDAVAHPTLGRHLRAVDILRYKLAFFGVTRFDPRSDKWLRITLCQGAPFPGELAERDWDDWIWPA